MRRHPQSWYCNDSNREPAPAVELISVPEEEIKKAIQSSDAKYKIVAGTLWMYRQKAAAGMWAFTDCPPVRQALVEIGVR